MQAVGEVSIIGEDKVMELEIVTLVVVGMDVVFEEIPGIDVLGLVDNSEEAEALGLVEIVMLLPELELGLSFMVDRMLLSVEVGEELVLELILELTCEIAISDWLLGVSLASLLERVSVESICGAELVALEFGTDVEVMLSGTLDEDTVDTGVDDNVAVETKTVLPPKESV